MECTNNKINCTFFFLIERNSHAELNLRSQQKHILPRWQFNVAHIASPVTSVYSSNAHFILYIAYSTYLFNRSTPLRYAHLLLLLLYPSSFSISSIRSCIFLPKHNWMNVHKRIKKNIVGLFNAVLRLYENEVV